MHKIKAAFDQVELMAERDISSLHMRLVYNRWLLLGAINGPTGCCRCDVTHKLFRLVKEDIHTSDSILPLTVLAPFRALRGGR